MPGIPRSRVFLTFVIVIFLLTTRGINWPWASGSGTLLKHPVTRKAPLRLIDAEPSSADPIHAFDHVNIKFGGNDLSVQLLSVDSKCVVSETTVNHQFGFAMLSLDNAPWTGYPAASRIRIFLRGTRFSRDLPIEVKGVEGLYPDDVYAVELR